MSDDPLRWQEVPVAQRRAVLLRLAGDDRAVDYRDRLEEELFRWYWAACQDSHEIEQMCARALGYSTYGEGPGSDLCAVGEHIPQSLVAELIDAYHGLKVANDE